MGQVHKRLGQTAPAAVTPTTIYTAPAATTTIVSEFAICGTGPGGDAFHIFIVPTGNSAGVANAICYSVQISPGNPCFMNIAQTLNTGDFIVVESVNGNITFTVSGLEIS